MVLQPENKQVFSSELIPFIFYIFDIADI